MIALSKNLPRWTGWPTKVLLMEVWRVKHAFQNGGLEHSAQKSTFHRQINVMFSRIKSIGNLIVIFLR